MKKYFINIEKYGPLDYDGPPPLIKPWYYDYYVHISNTQIYQVCFN